MKIIALQNEQMAYYFEMGSRVEVLDNLLPLPQSPPTHEADRSLHC